jgi:hypothetical protein
MAQLTAKEFDDLVSILANHLRLDRLHERLVKANALVSRKRPQTSEALASQLYQLSAGLRRVHPARYAVETLWQEMLSQQLKEGYDKILEALADRVNGCLTERMTIIPEKQQELIASLGAYYQAIASCTTDDIAYLEMVLRASTDVAHFLRAHWAEIVATRPPPPATSTGTTSAGEKEQGEEEGREHEA